MVFKVSVDQKKCIGCGSCAAICPDNFELKNGKSFAKKAEVQEISCNKEAADICPVGAIKVVEK